MDRQRCTMAAGDGHEAVVRLLEEKEVDFEARNKDGKTALHNAAEKWRPGAVPDLRGCDSLFLQAGLGGSSPVACWGCEIWLEGLSILAIRSTIARLFMLISVSGCSLPSTVSLGQSIHCGAHKIMQS